MPTPNSVSVSQLYRLIGTSDCPVILDVRTQEDFDDDPRLLPSALKRDFDKIDALVSEFSGDKVIIYCQKGLKISQGTAALLREAGMIEEFGPNSSVPLNTLAQIVRGADTNRHDLAPEAAGLLAISAGLSRMYRDDLEQLEAGMLVYDAFYRWARDAKDEGHDWPSAFPSKQGDAAYAR